MDSLWLLKGPLGAPGWGPLEDDSRENKVEVLLFDWAEWALIRAPAAPASYEGLAPAAAPDGLFLDPQGRAVYVAAGREVKGPREVLAALGQPAQELLEAVGDPDTVLERLGRVF